ncbi:MAG: shikimate kinase [Gammaproteobacteria bacterium]|nr:shikimate kinase [Gammaproteobacteria bacterium]
MGAGKTTIGKILARTLGKEFIDSDKKIEESTGASINLIFDVEGEEGFRRRERDVIEELTRLHGLVLATGGGAILHEDNRRNLSERGFVVYLLVPFAHLYQRVRLDRNRPLLRHADPEGRLLEIVTQRDPLYRATADLILDTEHRTVRQIVDILQASIPSCSPS